MQKARTWPEARQAILLSLAFHDLAYEMSGCAAWSSKEGFAADPIPADIRIVATVCCPAGDTVRIRSGALFQPFLVPP